MANKNHLPFPPRIDREGGYIGQPTSSVIAQQIADAANYARMTWGPGQIYTYSGPFPQTTYVFNPDYDHIDQKGGVVEFPVILHSPPKTDATKPERQLYGELLPWRYATGYSPGHYVDQYPRVYWRALQDDETCNRTIFRTQRSWPIDFYNRDKEDRLSPDGMITLFDFTGANLFLDGAAERDTWIDINNFWEGENGALIAYDTVNYYGGTQSLKITDTGTANPRALGPYIDGVAQLVTGATYSLSGWAKGDGTAAPKVLSGATTLWTGTTSTSWQHFDAVFQSAADVLKFEATVDSSSKYVNFDNIEIKEIGRFRYEPDADGEFTVGFLGVERICVAALSIWTAPDRYPTDTEMRVLGTDLHPGRAVRGYTGTGQASIGDLEYMAGYGGALYNVDDVERNTRKCLLQSGHPLGLSTQQYASYYNIRGGNASYFNVYPRNLRGLATGNNVSTIPALYGWCQGAAEGNEAYVKYTALTSGDTWEYTISSDTPALWTDANRLEVDAAGDKIKIEVKAPDGGWMVIGAYSDWEDSYEQ